MPTLLRPSFPHRYNSDGSYDSICTVCLATIATAQNEWELARYESAHVCEPLDLYRMSQVGRDNQSFLCSFLGRATSSSTVHT